MSHDLPILSVVVPCYNEQDCIVETYGRLVSVLSGLPLPFELVFIDDGSRDETTTLLAEIQAGDSRVKLICFSRNFGHQFAITAGLEHASGQAVIVIDADLQDPPEVIPEMVQRWNEGWEVIYGMRLSREGATLFKRACYKLFYRILNSVSQIPIPLDTGDFRLMDRKVVDALLSLPERDRFLRGMVSWVGFSQTPVTYHRAPRLAGTSKYPLWKLVKLATDGVLSFSTVPLRIASILGLAASAVAMVGVVAALLVRLLTKHWVTGWTSLFLAIMFLGGVQLVCLGIFGEYLGRIYGETKHRPLYVIREKLGFSAPEPSAPARAASLDRHSHT